MKLKELKQYTAFILISAAFAITLITSAIVYLIVTEKIDGEEAKKQISIEINLPVMEWGKYDTLSKKYPNDKL